MLVVGLAGGGGVLYWAKARADAATTSPLASATASHADPSPAPSLLVPPRKTVDEGPTAPPVASVTTAVPTRSTTAAPRASALLLGSASASGSASGSASASDAGASPFVFDLATGRQVGLGERSAAIMSAVRGATESVRACGPPPAAGALWGVSLRYEWPKGGGHKIFGAARKNGADDPANTALVECVKAKLEAAKVPDADGQVDVPSGTSYLVFGYDYVKR